MYAGTDRIKGQVHLQTNLIYKWTWAGHELYNKKTFYFQMHVDLFQLESAM